MNLTNTLQNTLSKLTGTTLNRYRLDIPSCLSPLDVEDFSGNEGLSNTYHYNILFTSTDKNIDADQLLRKPATLTMGTGLLQNLMEQKVVHGVITDFRRISGSADQVNYQITLEPFIALLDNQYRTHRFFVNKSVPEVVEQILKEHGLKDWEYEFTLKQTYPKREQINQYQETDLTFIERLLSEMGIFYFFTLQPDTQTEVVHFADKQSAYEFGKTLPLNSPSGMSDRGAESVWGLSVHHNVVEASVTAKDYNYREAQKVLQSTRADMTRGDGESTTYGEVYHYKPRHLDTGDKTDPTAETANFLARLDHERFLSAQTLITGLSTDPTLHPAQVLTVTDTSIPSTLPELLTHPMVVVRTGFSASRKDALKVTIAAVPYSETLCWRPALLPRPKVSGTMMARVTSAKSNDIYAWQDTSGLYRVKFDADQDDKAQGQESMPVRLAKPYGGDVYGIHFPLIQGTEVAIAFHDGDPDRPYIAHALHDSRHTDHVTEKNNTRNVIRTPAFNKLRMEDKRGEEHIKLSTEYGGKTQLNLGHNVDVQRNLRGEGFELRTDEWGAVRAGKGVFISADKQASASGKILEMQDAMTRLKQASEQMDTLSNDAQTAKAEPAQVEAQLAFMRDQIDQLKEAVAVLSAPKGIALSSGKHLQLAAERNLMFSAGADTDMGVMKRLFIGVGEGLSLFVRKMGIKIIANQGPVTIQAQNDQLQLLARQGLEITSTEDEISIVAKKKITLNAGGSYITLDPYKIELGTNGDFVVKAADFAYNGPASMKADHPEYPPIQANTLQALRLSVPQSPNAAGTSWAGMPYSLYADGALLKKGVLDKSGQLDIEHQVVTQNYRLEMANGASYQIPIVDAYRNAEQGVLANRGLHNHTAQSRTNVNSAMTNTDHRNLYAELLDGLSNKEES
ncbi:type VI secretion system Vgr family protein [Yersinia similis]|uniref:type VI secretion system Vgr family protein n=1 Tax=Yersinia similis TaxID=367190 RepID=UPI00061C026A|nr:type VI secretion system tip protein VgrG [Yersinia similis]CNC51724.1 Rhs element Vgr protein [Yersinia similis]